jgi:hypothetical protein
MAMIDYSVGFSVAEIEEILAVHKAELKKTLTAYANDGSSYTKRHIDEIHTVIKACQDALVKLAPEKYARKGRTVAVSHVDSQFPL